VFSPLEISGKISACENIVVSMMLTGSPVSGPSRSSAGSSATPRPASSVSNGGEKTLCGACGAIHRTFYDHKVRLVRDLPCGDTRVYLEIPVRRVLCKRCGKVKRERLEFLFRQPLLHEAVRLLRWPAMPRFQHPGRCQGSVHGPAHGQGTGEAVHAGVPGSVPPSRRSPFPKSVPAPPRKSALTRFPIRITVFMERLLLCVVCGWLCFHFATPGAASSNIN